MKENWKIRCKSGSNADFIHVESLPEEIVPPFEIQPVTLEMKNFVSVFKLGAKFFWLRKQDGETTL